MAKRTRNFLFTGPFSNGQRPDENDFNDVWESFINYEDDPILHDTTTGNFIFSNAVEVGGTTGVAPGTIRFSGGVFEFREGGAWRTLGAASGGAFEEVAGGPHVVFDGGNVGIGTGTVSPTDFKMHVALGHNSSDINNVANRVRIGNAAIFNQTGGNINRRAHFSHHDMAGNNDYALRQESDGDVNLNSPNTKEIRLSQNGNTIRLVVRGDGTIEIPGVLEVAGVNVASELNDLDARLTAIGG